MLRVKCKHRPICYELDLCRKCLQSALKKEDSFVPDPVVVTYEWQICVGCKKRLVYYNSFGLCLHCTVKEFAKEVVIDEPDHEATQPEPDFPEHNEFHEPAPVSLTNIEETIVTLHQRESWSMDRIGELLQLSERMVSEIYSAALEKTNKTPHPERTSS